MTPRAIEGGLLVSAAGLTGRLKRLETAGWIFREPSPTDGRLVLVRLTPAGLTEMDRLLPEHCAFESSLLAPLDEQARRRTARTLRRLLHHLEASRRN